jgi:hypothetical protein
VTKKSSYKYSVEESIELLNSMNSHWITVNVKNIDSINNIKSLPMIHTNENKKQKLDKMENVKPLPGF